MSEKEIKMKRERTVSNVTVHTLDYPQDIVDRAYPEIKGQKATVFTGIVVEDPTGKWDKGYHMRSSIIVDRGDGYIETINTMYYIVGNEPDPYFEEDIGNAAGSIFY